MAENNDETEKREKSVAYFSALVNAWLQTRAEKDKSLLTISTAAIGVLITFLVSKMIVTVPVFIVFISALFSFLVCAISVIAIFSSNADHIEEVIDSGKKRSKLLFVLDGIAYISFIVGLVLTLIIGIIVGIQNLSK
jgi:hypothetical protein